MFTIQVFRSLRFCLSPGILRGVVASLCLVVFGCGHGKVLSMQTAPILEENESDQAAMGLDKFFLHDECTGEYPPQPDTCLHDRLHEHSSKFGGKSGAVYDVTLRIRGIFEPTTILGGDTPDPAHPYLKGGGAVSTPDWSQWQIEISDPKQTYWLNHYPRFRSPFVSRAYGVICRFACLRPTLIGRPECFVLLCQGSQLLIAQVLDIDHGVVRTA